MLNVNEEADQWCDNVTDRMKGYPGLRWYPSVRKFVIMILFGVWGYKNKTFIVDFALPTLLLVVG